MKKKQACLVLLGLNPPAQTPFSWICCEEEELPVWEMCSSQCSSLPFKENRLGLIANHDTGLAMHECRCRSVLASQYSVLGWSVERFVFVVLRDNGVVATLH